MSYHINSSQNRFHKIITTEQLNQVIEAITDGRYSWACVLILRFVGYNPLHFIPQRTYSRLMKDNRQVANIPVSLNNGKSISTNSSVTNSSVVNKVSSQGLNQSNASDYLTTSEPDKMKNIPGYLETKIAVMYSRNK
jgi:hypothetical protein